MTNDNKQKRIMLHRPHVHATTELLQPSYAHMTDELNGHIRQLERSGSVLDKNMGALQ